MGAFLPVKTVFALVNRWYHTPMAQSSLSHLQQTALTISLNPAIFVGCGNNSNHSHSYEAEEHEVHEHSHDGHDHDHDHDHDHNHDAEHAHDHDHSHDAHAEESHNHAPGIIEFTKAQADAAELEIETVQPASFNAVIRTSGEILPAQGDEKTIVAITISKASIVLKLSLFPKL